MAEGFKRIYWVWLSGWTLFLLGVVGARLAGILDDEPSSTFYLEALAAYIGYGFVLPGFIFAATKAVLWIRDGFRS